MNRKMIFLAVVVLALATLACSININLPSTQVKTGPTVSENVNIPYPQGTQANFDVTLKFGAGTLAIQPGTSTDVISGTVKYNVTDFKPKISNVYEDITMEQGNLKLGGIPYINQNIVNEWNLSIGSLAERPMSLLIEAGAYTGKYELGGLWLNRLNVTDGASKVNLNFSQPNRVAMSSLEYTTGASDVTLKGLGNASPTTLSFKGGAGNYTLDFSGALQRDMDVTIESGVSTVTIIVPGGTSAKLLSDSSLITVNMGGSWQQQGNLYQVAGSGYTITIHAKMGAGTLRLETSR